MSGCKCGFSDCLDMPTVKQHWLVFDFDRRITGCHCGFVASEGDEGLGDSVVEHLMRVGRAS